MKFSIITVCYNSEKTLQRTIDAMLAQTCQDYEYIIVDGKSKDNTLQIIKDAEPKFNGRLKWISEPDSGIYNAMNKGIAMAKGDIIGIINSDDWYSPDALEVVANCAENRNIESTVFTGGMLFHYKKGKPGLSMPYETEEETIKGLKRLRMCVNHPSTFVPKAVYDKIGSFDERYKIAADADLMIRCAFAGISFFPIKAVLANMAEGGMTTSNNPAILKDRRIMFEKFIESSFVRRMKMLQYYIYYLAKGMTPRFLINYIRKIRVK